MEAADTHTRTSLTRALYAPVVLIAPSIAAWLFVDGWVDYVTHPRMWWGEPRAPVLQSLVTLAGFIIPGALAWRRVILTRHLLPDRQLNDRPVVAFVVASTSLVTLALLWLTIQVYADAGNKGFRADLGPLGGAVLLAVMTSAVALLVAEFVLVGFDETSSDSGRSPGHL